MSVNAQTREIGTLVTTKAIMKLLGYTDRAAFSEFLKASDLPRYRINQRRYLFDLEEVKAWLATRKIGGVR